MLQQKSNMVKKEIAKVVDTKSIIPEFSMGGVPMEIAEKILGMSRKTIMDMMERGDLDIGIVTVAQKKRGTRSYRNSYIILGIGMIRKRANKQ